MFFGMYAYSFTCESKTKRNSLRKIKMIKIYNFYFGDYYQKLFMDGNKIIDAECKCRWGKVHKKAWKNGEKVCKHLDNSIMHLNLRLKKYGNKFKEKESSM